MIKHIAFIMDGNRRWAKAQGSKLFYESQSKDAVKTVVSYCLKNQILHLSLYLFCIENFKRNQEETSFLFKAIVEALNNNLAEFVKQEIRIRFIGERSLFPENTLNIIKKTEEATQDFKKLELNFLFCYGGRQEIVSATKTIAKKILTGELSIEDVNTDSFKQYLWTYPTPAPEIIVRTGNDHRLSDFLLYQAAYSEIYFLECLWPDITDQDIEEVIERFKKSKKNFGV